MIRFALAAPALLCSMAVATPASVMEPAGLATPVIEVATFDQLGEKFCTAGQTRDLIMVLPASLFVDARELICPHGPYKMYRIIEHNDPDDFEYYVDPPFGAHQGLGCDGKAGRAMEVLAVNCRPIR